MSVTRLVAPKPRKPILALFDQPGFNGKSLLPLPDGVGEFLELSISPNQLLDTISELGPPGVVKDKIDNFAETFEKTGNVDLRKDLLAHLGPRMILYVAPDGPPPPAMNRSRRAGSRTSTLRRPWRVCRRFPRSPWSLRSNDPVRFGKILDGAVIALNDQLKVEALEKAAEEQTEEAGQGAGAAPGANAGRAGREEGCDAQEGSAPPFFRLRLGSEIRAGCRRSQGVDPQTPRDSPIRLGPPGVRPSIRLEGKYLAISIAGDAAETALKAVKRKDWKPSDEVQRASEHLPPKMVILAMGDPRDALPQLLATLPGTLQTIINLMIAQGRAQAGNNAMGGGMNQPGGRPGMMGPRGAGSRPGMAGGRFGGGPGGPGGRGDRGGSDAAAAPGGNAGATSPTEGMITLKVDADKLPNAEAIRSRLFMTTVAISVSDQDIRLTTRQAFFSPVTLGIGAGLMLPAVQAARAAAQRAREAAAAEAPAAAPGGPGGPPGGRSGMPGRGGPPGRPGGPGGRRGRPGG